MHGHSSTGIGSVHFPVLINSPCVGTRRFCTATSCSLPALQCRENNETDKHGSRTLRRPRQKVLNLDAMLSLKRYFRDGFMVAVESISGMASVVLSITARDFCFRI